MRNPWPMAHGAAACAAVRTREQSTEITTRRTLSSRGSAASALALAARVAGQPRPSRPAAAPPHQPPPRRSARGALHVRRSPSSAFRRWWPGASTADWRTTGAASQGRQRYDSSHPSRWVAVGRAGAASGSLGQPILDLRQLLPVNRARLEDPRCGRDLAAQEHGRQLAGRDRPLLLPTRRVPPRRAALGHRRR